MDELKDRQEDTTVEVGKQIRHLREQRKLSQAALAEMSSISRNTLSLIERGQTSPTVATLKSLAEALSVDINAFFLPYEESNVVFTKGDQRPNLQLDHGVLNDLGLGRNIDETLRMVDALQHHEKYGEVCPANWSKGADAMKPTADGVASYLTKHGN